MNNDDSQSSAYFRLSMGVRQGGPLSPYLFILVMELFAQAVRDSTDIQGITVRDTEIKNSLFCR